MKIDQIFTSHTMYSMLSILMMTVLAAAENIINNPGFETYSTIAAPCGWKMSPTGFYGRTVCSEYAHSGTNSVLLSKDIQWIYLEKDVTTNQYGSFKGKGVIFSIWGFTPKTDPLDGAWGGIELRFYNEHGNLCNPGTESAPIIDHARDKDTWIYGSISAKIPYDCVQIGAFLRRAGGPEGIVCFDDCSLRIVPEREIPRENINLAELYEISLNDSCMSWLQSTSITMNIIVNPGYEHRKSVNEPEDGFSGAGWGRWDTGPYGPKRSRRYAHNGRYSAVIYNDNHALFPYKRFFEHEYGSFRAKEALLSVWALTPENARLSNSVGKLVLEFYTSDNKTCNPFRVTKTVVTPAHEPGVWKKGKLTAGIPDNCARMDVYLSKGYDGIIQDDIDADTYKKLYTGAGEIYFDDVEFYIRESGKIARAQQEIKSETEQKWRMAGPFNLNPAGKYDSNYYLQVIKTLPNNFEIYAPEISFETVQCAKIEPNGYFLPHVMSAVVWNTNMQERIIPGYITLFSTWHDFGCNVRMPWECLKINGIAAEKHMLLRRGVTNIFITYTAALRKENETNDCITIDFGRHGVYRIPVAYELVDGAWRLQRPNDFTNQAYTEALPSYWRDSERVGERLSGIDSMPEHSLLFSQYTWISPVDQTGVLYSGSDDAVNIWLNGRHIYTYPYGRGYAQGDDILPVPLKKGTNYFLFGLINGAGKADLGADLYSYNQPLSGRIKLKAFNSAGDSKKLTGGKDYLASALTGETIKIDFFWLKPEEDTNTLHWETISNRPICKMIQVKAPGDYGVVYEKQTMTNSVYPLLLNMRGKPDGVYRIEAEWDGKKHNDSFLYFSSNRLFTATQRWWLRLFSEVPEVDLADMFEMYRTEKDFQTLFSGRTVRAYESKYDQTLQPYGLEVPVELAGKSNIPLIVYLQAEQNIKPEQWSRQFLGGTADQKEYIRVTPYGRGGRPHEGLVEKDIMDVIDDVCSVLLIDRDRIYLEGHCQGAAGVWRLASKYPDVFAGCMPHSGFPLALYINKLYRNMLNVPVWHYHPEFDNPEMATAAIKELQKMGGDARIYIKEGGGKGSSDPFVIHDIRQWILNQKRVTRPIEVYYSSYGDLRGAYWIDDIMPGTFGYPATVYARIDTNTVPGIEKNDKDFTNHKTLTNKYPRIHVTVNNTAQFSLDLTGKPFIDYPEWHVYVNNKGPYAGKSGEYVPVILEKYEKQLSGLRKSPGMSGGLADCINAGIVIAYATDAEGASLQKRAEAFYEESTGQGYFKLTGNFPLIADTNITEEISRSRNIILFQSAEIPGLWYEAHKERIPVTFANGEIEIGGKKGREMVCIYPNPLATNRYIVLVCAEKLSPEIIWRNHCDILLDDVSGSFDRFWHTIYWRNGEGYPRTDSNKIAQTEQISGYTTIKSKSNAAKKESLLKRVGRIVVLIIGGCLVMYFVGRSVYERIVGRE